MRSEHLELNTYADISLFNCDIDTMSVEHSDILYLYCTRVDELCYTGRYKPTLKYDDSTEVGKTRLLGSDVEYSLWGVRDFEPLPDPKSSISVIQRYSCE